MKIEEINQKIKELNKLKKLLSIPINEDDPVEEKIFKQYLALENVSKVASYINELGCRINNRKYIANDISAVITNKDIKLKNNELRVVVLKLFKAHKRGVKRISW